MAGCCTSCLSHRPLTGGVVRIVCRHFDENGNYIRDKKTGVADAWLDSIDAQETSVYVPKVGPIIAIGASIVARSTVVFGMAWQYVKKKEEPQGEEQGPVDRRALMEKIASLLKPDETVTKVRAG